MAPPFYSDMQKFPCQITSVASAHVMLAIVNISQAFLFFLVILVLFGIGLHL